MNDSNNDNNNINENKEENNNDNENIENFNKIFDEILQKNNNSLTFKNEFKPLSKMSKRSQTIKNDDNKNKSNILNNNNNNNQHKTPIEFELYKEAKTRKEKKEKMEYNNMMNILLNSQKVKISNNSHKIAINKIEREIDETIAKYENNNQISFIDAGKILSDLKIFREMFKDDLNNNNNSNNNNNNSKINNNNNNNNNKHKKIQSYKDIQHELLTQKEKEERKQKEINFYEQLWLIINPNNTEFIKTDIFSETLKILFTPVNPNYKEISEILKQFLLTAFFLNSNPNDVKIYKSPITHQNVKEELIWDAEKLVKEFLLLKENLLAYKNIKHNSKRMEKDIENNKKNICFKPKINNNNNINNENDNKYFEKRLEFLEERKNLREKVLNEMRKENEIKEMEECTFKPKINKTYSNKFNNNNNNNNNKLNNNNNNIFEKLYKTNEGKYERLNELKNLEKKMEEDKELEQCTFKPNLISQNTLEQCLNSTEKPKGYEEFSKKMREGIMKAAEKKYLENKIPIGENYEKIKNKKIQPFNITDLKKYNKNNNNNIENNNNNKSNDFFTIQIKIPNGKERMIKVYVNEDPYDIANNFCKTYGLKKEVIERLAKTILNFRNLYLQKNNINNNNNN